MAGVSATGVAGTGVGVVGTDAGAGALLGLVSANELGLREKRVGGVFSTAAFSLIGRAGGLLSRVASVSICLSLEQKKIEIKEIERTGGTNGGSLISCSKFMQRSLDSVLYRGWTLDKPAEPKGLGRYVVRARLKAEFGKGSWRISKLTTNFGLKL